MQTDVQEKLARLYEQQSSPGALRGLVDRGVLDAQDAFWIIEHNATHPEPLSPHGWTDAWVFNTLLTVIPVRASRQEAAALRHFERSQPTGA